MTRKKGKSDLIRIMIIVACSFVMALNIKTFVRTGGLYPGGATGLTILIQRAAEKFLGLSIPYTPINILLNAGPVYIGFKYIGKKFTLYSCLMIVLSSVFTDMIPGYALTDDILLISIFGGIISGSVVSLCLTADATTGGTDFISIFLSQRSGMDSFNIILGINAVILCASGLMFGWDKALYSIIYQYVSTVVVHTLYKRYQQATLFIVTENPEKVCKAIYEKSHHGATILHGEGSFDHHQKQTVYSVVSSSEARRVVGAVKEEDEAAFINVIRTQALIGHFYQPPKD